MTKFNIIIYVFVFSVVSYSLVLWIDYIKWKKKIKILKSKYPNGFICHDEKFLTSATHKNLPSLEECDKKLFKSIGISNFAYGEPIEIDWTGYEYTPYFGD